MTTPTIGDIGKMNPMELLRLVISASGEHALRGLSKNLETALADPEAALGDGVSSEVDGPVPVPFGVLKGRENLGPLGVSVKVILTVVPLPEEFLAPPTDDDIDPAPDTNIVVSGL